MRLLDGPAEGTYMVRRAPFYLRAVVRADGVRDVLDQPDDRPSSRERVHVYRLVSEVQQVHVRMTRGSGFYVMADYRHMPEVDGETLREAETWRTWAQAQE